VKLEADDGHEGDGRGRVHDLVDGPIATRLTGTSRNCGTEVEMLALTGKKGTTAHTHTHGAGERRQSARHHIPLDLQGRILIASKRPSRGTDLIFGDCDARRRLHQATSSLDYSIWFMTRILQTRYETLDLLDKPLKASSWTACMPHCLGYQQLDL